jgi:glycosyltransferase involved in cell wall biosynthesis
VYTRDALQECFERIGRLQPGGRPRRFGRLIPTQTFAFPGPLIREIVHYCDRVAFRPGAMRRLCAISETVARREGYFPPGVDVVPVPHPTHLTGFRAPGEGRYFFTVSYLDDPKRIDLLIEATRRLGAEAELWIAGSGPREEQLKALAGDDRRIRFLGFVNDEALLDLYAQALCVLFVPMDEDLGLVALEAMTAGKPVITTHDAGGVSELVGDGETGIVADPDPGAIADAMRRLQSDPALARTMGQRGREQAAAVSWARVGETLLEGIAVEENVAPSPA